MKKNSGKSSIIEGLLMFAFVNTIFGFIYIEIIFVYLNKMKIVYFLFASVLLLINCRDKCEGLASSKSDCTDYQLKDDEKDDGNTPLGDAVLPLLMMSLAFCGYLYLRRKRSEA